MAHGRMTYRNGSVYTGGFLNGKRHGQGKMVYANGDVYEGAWSRGKMHGQGTYTCATGAVFQGVWTYTFAREDYGPRGRGRR